MTDFKIDMNPYQPLSTAFTNHSLVSLNSDGSFFHALCAAYSLPYIQEKIGNMSINRQQFITNLKSQLALKLVNYDLLDKKDKTELRDALQSDGSIDSKFDKYIGDLMDKDVYVLDGKTRDVKEGIVRKRESVILLDLGKKYKLVGRIKDNQIQTIFTSDDDLIDSLKERQKELKV